MGRWALLIPIDLNQWLRAGVELLWGWSSCCSSLFLSGVGGALVVALSYPWLSATFLNALLLFFPPPCILNLRPVITFCDVALMQSSVPCWNASSRGRKQTGWWARCSVVLILCFSDGLGFCTFKCFHHPLHPPTPSRSSIFRFCLGYWMWFCLWGLSVSIRARLAETGRLCFSHLVWAASWLPPSILLYRVFTFSGIFCELMCCRYYLTINPPPLSSNINASFSLCTWRLLNTWFQ